MRARFQPCFLEIWGKRLLFSHCFVNADSLTCRADVIKVEKPRSGDPSSTLRSETNAVDETDRLK